MAKISRVAELPFGDDRNNVSSIELSILFADLFVS